MQITERDWKLFQKKIPEWQEAYMERLVKEYLLLLQSDKTASGKFWELEKRIKQDTKSPGVIMELRRSAAITTIIRLVADEVILPDDLEEFSDELKETVNYAAKVK